HFIGLHELFDKIAEEVESYVDVIAERIVQLGGIAEGTVPCGFALPARRISAGHCRWSGTRGSSGLSAIYVRSRARMTIEQTEALGDTRSCGRHMGLLNRQLN